MTLTQRIEAWETMTPRHKDFHWRMMTEEERRIFRENLPPPEQRKLRERFAWQPQPLDRPYLLYKRLSKEELYILREQVKRAQPNAPKHSHTPKTPALEEIELFLAGTPRHPHVFIFMQGDSKPNPECEKFSNKQKANPDAQCEPSNPAAPLPEPLAAELSQNSAATNKENPLSAASQP